MDCQLSSRRQRVDQDASGGRLRAVGTVSWAAESLVQGDWAEVAALLEFGP